MKEEIIIKEDWKGEAIKKVIERIGYGIGEAQAERFIEQITESVSKVDIKISPSPTK